MNIRGSLSKTRWFGAVGATSELNMIVLSTFGSISSQSQADVRLCIQYTVHSTHM